MRICAYFYFSEYFLIIFGVILIYICYLTSYNELLFFVEEEGVFMYTKKDIDIFRELLAKDDVLY